MKLYRIAEIAKIFKVSRQAVYKWIKKKKMKAIKTPGGDLRVTQKEIDKFVGGK